MKSEIEIFNQLFEGLKFKDAEYSEKTNTCVVCFLYNPELFKPTDENKNSILNKLKDVVGDYVKFELSLISCPLDKRAIANHTYMTIVNNFPALSKNFTYDDVSVEIDGMNVKIILKLSPSNFEYGN